MTLVMFFVPILLLSSLPYGTAVPLSSFYSYGSAAGDTALSPTNDGSSPPITLPTPFNFFGTKDSTIYVSQLINTKNMRSRSFKHSLKGEIYNY